MASTLPSENMEIAQFAPDCQCEADRWSCLLFLFRLLFLQGVREDFYIQLRFKYFNFLDLDPAVRTACQYPACQEFAGFCFHAWWLPSTSFMF